MVTKTRDGNETGKTRTTLTLDDDVLMLIRRRAEVTGESMGKIVSELIRESTAADYGEEEVPIPGQYYKGVLLVPKHGERRTITTEFIRDLMDEFP